MSLTTIRYLRAPRRRGDSHRLALVLDVASVLIAWRIGHPESIMLTVAQCLWRHFRNEDRDASAPSDDTARTHRAGRNAMDARRRLARREVA
jgi:hypothetical protein